jgi:hypothetical protein
MTKVLTAIALFALFSNSAFPGAEEAWSEFENYFATNGVSENSLQMVGQLEQLVEKEIELEVDKGKNSKDDDEKEESELNLVFLKEAKKHIQKSYNKSLPSAFRLEHFMISKRILYSVKSKNFSGDKKTDVVIEILLRNKMSIKNIKKEDRDKAIGLELAKLEASDLFDVKNNNFYSEESLSKLSPYTLSELDIHDQHIFWYSERKLKSEKLDSWSYLENFFTNHANLKVKKKNKDFKGSYNLEKARKVLFYSNMKDTATSAKINTKDIYGGKWKLKWGTETHTEVVANRLYTKLGAKFTDLVYAGKPGYAGHILILEGDDSSCESIRSFSYLKKCLLESVYNFNIEVYTLHHGVIDNGNLNKIFGHLKDEEKNLEKVQDLTKFLGKEFVTFKTSMVEYKFEEGYHRGGPISLSHLGAKEDRVKRGLFLFNSWIRNYDAKDDNARSVVVEDFQGEDKKYLEFYHDLGASLGPNGRSGLFNELDEGKDYISYGSSLIYKDGLSKFITLPGNSRIFFPGLLAYRPESWEQATFSDLRWMARKITKLSRKDLEEIVKLTYLPSFSQRVFVDKLLKRRDRIAEVFDLSVADPVKEEFNFSFNILSDEERAKAAKMFGLPENELHAMALKSGIINVKKKKFIDHVVKDGKISSCQHSAIVNLLEKYHFPEGISRKQKKKQDDKALPLCEFLEVKKAPFPHHH